MNSKTAITLFMLVAGAVLLPASLTNADGNPVRNPGEIVKKADWK
jgi:hypothetical protein